MEQVALKLSVLPLILFAIITKADMRTHATILQQGIKKVIKKD